MIWPNKPGRKYREYADFVNLLVNAGSAPISVFTSVWRLLYGSAYDDLVNGIQVTTTTENDPSTTGTGYTIVLHTPWGTHTLSGSTFLTSALSKIEIDPPAGGGPILTLNADCSWVFAFDELRWYVDLGAGYVLRKTISAQSQSGINFDKRLNAWYALPQATEFPNLTILGPPICADTYAHQTVITEDATASIGGGWEWDDGAGWNSDSIALDTLAVPVITCDCTKVIPTITGSDSMDLLVTSLYFHDVTKVNNGHVTCPCGTGTAILDTWRTTDEQRTELAEIYAYPSDWGILKTTVHTEAWCNASETSPADVTTVEAVTYCAVYLSVNVAKGYRDCNSIFEQHCGPIIDPDDDGDPATGCVSFAYGFCTYLGIAVLTHPDHPPCADAIEDVDDLQSPGGEHYVAYTAGGEVWVNGSPFTETDWRVTVNVTGGLLFGGGWARPRIYVDLNLKLHLLAYHTNQGGTDPLSDGLYYFESNDNARTWGPRSSGLLAPELVLANATQGMTRGAKDGPLMRVIFIPDAGTSGPGTFKLQYKPNPDAAWSALSGTLKDQAGADIRGAGYQWGFDHASESEDRWSLSLVEDGATVISSYYCADLINFTWKLEI